MRRGRVRAPVHRCPKVNPVVPPHRTRRAITGTRCRGGCFVSFSPAEAEVVVKLLRTRGRRRARSRNLLPELPSHPVYLERTADGQSGSRAIALYLFTQVNYSARGLGNVHKRKRDLALEIIANHHPHLRLHLPPLRPRRRPRPHPNSAHCRHRCRWAAPPSGRSGH